jgi:hypothetical protein
MGKEERDYDAAYHGSHTYFKKFDPNKIGSGEGFKKRGEGLYLHEEKKLMPYFANIRSFDAPVHFGSTPRLKETNPTIYTISGLKDLKLKEILTINSKKYARNQSKYEKEYDGFRVSNGEIVIFPKSVSKLKINLTDDIKSFIQKNKNVEFRKWTTDKQKEKEFGGEVSSDLELKLVAGFFTLFFIIGLFLFPNNLTGGVVGIFETTRSVVGIILILFGIFGFFIYNKIRN